jgi:formylglycine-generating enzyme required for sulfatase activity
MTKGSAKTNKKKISTPVSHGGSCYVNTDYLVTSYRGRTSTAYYQDSNIGLRIVRNMKEGE